ncbi:MAG: glycosyl hydrolase, partial [Planctomycetota bacterium]
VGSGGVWRTKNAGVTWKPIFDDQDVYSTGCITIDPSNSKVIWLGTGENVGGRHVGFGDGIYRSADGGDSWTNMGLKHSEHISKIIVHPKDSSTLWVAVQGPLWNKGGERGLYKTTDGGKTWKKTLGDDEWTGVTDIAMDPRNPDVLYAATWQRHRTVAAYMGGGPKSGLHRSSDGGQTWTQLKSGLPEGKLGKIGLAISPQKPDTLYAAIELNRRKGAVYRSTDQGSTWEKRSDTVSGGTGPHYYQELYASPHAYDLIYLADVRMQVSHDGGKTFERMQEKNKHSDNHALAFRADDPDYLLCGTDGGLYESFDAAENWRFINNLPLTQFYKIAIDDAAPFYNVYGGTQDNSTEGGPVRTDNPHGIQNSDWRVVLNWDGHQPATEPGNPNILYAERQEGHISRIDMATGEVVDIMPQAGDGDPAERFNWDAPILVSPHSPTRLYFASYRVWKSDNRGDSWAAISGDLTRNQNRVDLEIMGSTQSWDSPWDLYAMSTYNTITSLAESPKAAGLVYVGTDDGLIQVTEDDGQNWRKIEVGSLPDVPQTAFVNDIRADLHDADTVYVALDNHKYGDFKPYLLKSTDRGKSWQSITANLPERLLVWRVVQDHVQPSLMFAATEFGIYFTVNAGESWTQLKGGVPTISFRDIKIHRRDNDLVAASFGRGIYVLDDIGPLRELSKEQMSKPASLFATRDAWWYFPRPHLSFDSSKGSQGAAHFVAENPPFGAVFTYYLKDGFESAESERKEAEKNRAKSGKSNKVPTWDALDDESSSSEPTVWLTVRDAAGQIVRRISAPTEKGFHRVAWDLRYPSTQAIALEPSEPGEFDEPPTGVMAAPGTYTVTLSTHLYGEHNQLAGPVEFNVVPLRKGSLEGATPDKVAEFWQEYSATTRTYSAISLEMARQEKRLAAVRKA